MNKTWPTISINPISQRRRDPDAGNNRPTPGAAPQTPPRPRRQTTIRNPLKYAPSSRPTSSPPNIQSSQHSDYVPSNDFSATPRATEDLTVALHSEFIRLTLFWSPSRPGLDLPNHVIDFDIQKRSLTTKIHDVSFVSVDDGGLWIREFGHDRGAGRTPLEAKRGLGAVVEGRPGFDDARLGQLVGEALAVYFEEKGIRDKILIIAAAQSYVRFFEVTITEAYVSELTRNAADGEAPFQEHLHLTGTPWFDLRYPDHRVWAMRNLSGIVTLTDAWVY
ncbi:hypothetical protein Ct61P_15148 [Colletotrichum tofieldiae]|nr:hypothetical protein Ct61P_15148 [Colletotrichum tofieldiae]